MTHSLVHELNQIFMPKSVAVIGASNNTTKYGGRFLQTVLKFGFKGKLYPVNPKEDMIQGFQAFPDVEAIPGPVDLAVITVPDKHVLPAIRSCAGKSVKGVEILTSGFKESGSSGAQMEAELMHIAKESKMRIIGPNCFGLYCPSGGITLLPGVDFPKKSGSVGFISQSGGGACDTVNMGKGRGIQFSVLVSYGNGCDIDVVDMLNYFENDPETRIVGAYLEGVRDGLKFFNALKSCAQKKPVVIFKGGLTEQGQRGTIGHTGSMAGTKTTWEAAMKSAGAVMAEDIKDLADCLMAFQCLDGFVGKGAGVLAGGGLRCVEALDAASEFGFTVPVINEKTRAKMGSLLPPSGAVPGNPVDFAGPSMPPAVIIPIMEMLAEKKDIHFLVLYQMMMYIINNEKTTYQANAGLDDGLQKYHKDFAPAAEKIREETGKPLVIILPGIATDPELALIEKERMEARKYYTKHGIPCFESGRQAFSVLSRVAGYYRKRLSRDSF